MTKNCRGIVLLIGIFAPLAVLLAGPPIAQEVRYHDFADTRALVGIPHFLNVASNLPFLVVGALGLAGCLRQRPSGAAASWTVFFAGTALVAFGSAWYHVSPSNATLVWDRLPMTVAFTALFAGLVSEHLGERLEHAALPTAITVGVGSIAWWYYADDLRIYAWVQFAPLFATVLLLAVFPARYSHRSYLAYGLAFYIFAKLAESADSAILTFTGGAVSGHTLKHLLAAMAPLWIHLMLRERKPVARPDSEPIAA